MPPTTALLPADRLLELGRTAALTLLGQGGQGTARRNAWAAMSADAARGRARREAESAVREAAARHADGQAREVAAPGQVADQR